MEKVEFLNQTDFKEILEQDYASDNEYAFVNPMVLLNYLSSFNGGTILKIDANDDRYSRSIGLFLERYINCSMSLQIDPFEINSFHMLYNIPILNGVDRSITQMDIINFGLNEVTTLNKMATDFNDYDKVYESLERTLMAMVYYIKYREESDSKLDYFTNFITQNNLQEIFYAIKDTSVITDYLKNVLVCDFNYSEYRANIYIEEFCNKCIKE